MAAEDWFYVICIVIVVVAAWLSWEYYGFHSLLFTHRNSKGRWTTLLFDDDEPIPEDEIKVLEMIQRQDENAPSSLDGEHLDEHK